MQNSNKHNSVTINYALTFDLHLKSTSSSSLFHDKLCDNELCVEEIQTIVVTECIDCFTHKQESFKHKFLAIEFTQKNRKIRKSDRKNFMEIMMIFTFELMLFETII